MPSSSPSSEKVDAGQIQHTDDQSPTMLPKAEPHPDFSHIDEKKVLRKMDMRLIPMLAVLYLLSFLDRESTSLPFLDAHPD